ncbi:hypothetical protein C4Z28_008360, partial [Klebsiella pneumoniae subsp. pneumoniae]
LSPGEWTQTVIRVPGERSRHPPQRRRARARNGVAPQSAGSPSPSRQQTGKTRKGNAGGASARPGFPGAAGARSFEARPDGDRCPLRLLCSRISQQTSRPGFEIDLPAPACDQRSDCVHH